MKDAIPTIRKDLGENAIILGTRRINRNSVMGLLSRPMIEVTAAVDSPLSTSRSYRRNGNGSGNGNGNVSSNEINNSRNDNNGNNGSNGSNGSNSASATAPPVSYPAQPAPQPYHAPVPVPAPAPAPAPAPQPYYSHAPYYPASASPTTMTAPPAVSPFASAINTIGLQQFENLLSEITLIKNELHSLRTSNVPATPPANANSSANANANMNVNSDQVPEFTWTPQQHGSHTHTTDSTASTASTASTHTTTDVAVATTMGTLNNPVLNAMMSTMVSKGIHKEVVWRYLNSMDSMNLKNLSNEQLQNLILECITHLVPVKSDYYTNPQNKVIALVGPTGVGKTTTIAKMAATLSLKMQKRVALITIDNFRIGAVDQLRTYADIVNAPIYVASNARELQDAFQKCQDVDHILIDSMGRGQFDKDEIASIRDVLGDSANMDIAMVMSMSSNHSEMEDVFKSYRILTPNYVIFTKLDETKHFAPLLNIPTRYNTPLLFLSTGQNVPDDIEIPDIAKITGSILSTDSLLWSNS